MQQKLEKSLEEKEKEIESFQKHKFKANPVPADCLVPLLNSLDAERQLRIQQYKEQKATKNHMKLFSFTQTDDSEKKLILEQKYERKPYVFKAKKVPSSVSELK